MSQLNVDALRHSSGTGSGIDLQSSGNIAFDTNTLYVDSVNDRVGVNNAAPVSSFDVTGSEGINFNTSPLIEKVNIVAGTANANSSVNLLSGAVNLFTSANTGNWTLNLRASSTVTLDSIMSVGQVCVATIISNLGGSSGYITGFEIDGTSRTVEYQNGNAPSERGGTSGYDMYQYSIIKTGNNAFLIFGNKTYLS